GKTVYSAVRGFIVVQVMKESVKACAVTAYNNRGTLKIASNPCTHLPVHLSGTTPMVYEEEYLRDRMTESIEIVPAQSEPPTILHPVSHIRFEKKYQIDMNVRVKDVGHVQRRDISGLIRHYEEVEDAGLSTDHEYKGALSRAAITSDLEVLFE
ncbi:hypothetical protein EK21DRAFT_55338, partial [Setomelanomma holmii]